MLENITLLKRGSVITDQQELINELTIALSLVYNGEDRSKTERGAKILCELFLRPLEEPANWLEAMTQAHKIVKGEENE